MNIEIADVSGLPEALQTLVSDVDGKATLDLSKVMPSEDLTSLKNALAKERENVSEYRKHGKPDELASKLAELKELASKGGKGDPDAQAKMDAMKADYESRLSESNEKINGMMQRNAAAEMRTELAKAGFVPEAIDDIAGSAMSRVAFNDDGSVKVLSVDGKPMIGSGADHGATLKDLATELAGVKTYALLDAGKSGGGKPSDSGGKPEKTTMSRAAFEALDTVSKQKAMQNGTTLTD